MSSETEIRIKVRLDDDRIPSSIHWSTSDQQGDDAAAKAMLISIFEAGSKDTLKLDLWTKDMEVGEMDRFMYHTLRSLCDTYTNATNNTELGNEMMNFVEYFGGKIEGGSLDKG